MFSGYSSTDEYYDSFLYISFDRVNKLQFCVGKCFREPSSQSC